MKVIEKSPLVQIWGPATLEIVKQNWGKDIDVIIGLVNAYNSQKAKDWGVDRYSVCNVWSVTSAAWFHLGLITKEERDELRNPGVTKRRERRAKADRQARQIDPETYNHVLVRDGRCLRCGATEGLAVDHVVPIALGGSSHIGNLQTLCRSCNSSKGSKVQDYRPRLNVKRNDLCPCGSGRKYKNCCMPIRFSTSRNVWRD